MEVGCVLGMADAVSPAALSLFGSSGEAGHNPFIRKTISSVYLYQGILFLYIYFLS